MRTKRLMIGAAVTGVALTAATVMPAAAAEMAPMTYAPILSGNVELVLFGSNYHVTKATVHGVPDLPGPADYEIIYSATTSPTKTFHLVCGGSSTGGSCTHTFTIDATYAHGVGIKSCGTIQREDTGKSYGTPCKKW